MTLSAVSAMAKEKVARKEQSDASNTENSSQRRLYDLPLKVLWRICGFLDLDDFCSLELVCKALHGHMQRVWTRVTHSCLENDLAALSRMFPSAYASSMFRFSLPPDNLWAHNRYELDVLLPESCLHVAYPDLAFLLRKCTAIESMSLLSPPYKDYRVPAGRSFFRLLSVGTYESLAVLDLTMTSFELADLELCQHSLCELKYLCVDRCCIYLYRREVLATRPAKELRSVIVGFQKRRHTMAAGAKLFLATVADIFPEVKRVSARSTEYRSNGCITYVYGEEEDNSVYDFLSRQRRRSYCAALLKRAVAQFNCRMHEAESL